MKKCSQEKRSEESRVGQEEKREVRICSQLKLASVWPHRKLWSRNSPHSWFSLEAGMSAFCISLFVCEGVSDLWSWPLLVSRECSEAGVALPTAPGRWALQPGDGEIDKALMVTTPDNFCNHS